MSIKYFCDKCKSETGQVFAVGKLHQIRLRNSQGNQNHFIDIQVRDISSRGALTGDLCVDCFVELAVAGLNSLLEVAKNSKATHAAMMGNRTKAA